MTKKSRSQRPAEFGRAFEGRPAGRRRPYCSPDLTLYGTLVDLTETGATPPFTDTGMIGSGSGS